MTASSSQQQTWRPGDTVVLRYLRRTTGRPATAWPLTFVDEREDLVALYLPRGTRFTILRPEASPRGERSSRSYRRVNDTWRNDALRLMFPRRFFSIELLWSVDGSSRTFSGYYVNMEEPFRRSAIGFDTNDHELDVVVSPDLRWAWKDKDDFEEMVDEGLYSRPFAEKVRAEAAHVISLIEKQRSPFCDGWEQWRPDPSWSVPELPDDWLDVPPSPWERRAWAYPLDA